MIAAWQAMEKVPDKPATYYRAAAKNGIMNPLRGRASFGAESHRGTKDASSASSSIWATNSDGEDTLVVEPSVEAPYAAVDVEGAVREAVADLDESDRVLVFARYWEDMTFAEVAKMVGGVKTRLEWRWMKHVRPALEEALAPLRVA
jgi:DNA-directed RNA polymerase specialized sigma24 family protein